MTDIMQAIKYIIRIKVKKTVLTLITIATYMLCIYPTAWSQNHVDKHWYFGNNSSGIQFNRSNNTASYVTNPTSPLGMGGSAVASDYHTGELLFYTDGITVYDGCYLSMPNGVALNADNTINQPVAISSIPGAVNRYYIFTRNVTGSVSRSIVNMSSSGNGVAPNPPLGDVEMPLNRAIVGLNNRSEGMITVPHGNGIDFWLITQENNSSNYTATLIDNATLGGNFNHIISSNIGVALEASHLSYHQASKKIAVAIRSTGDNAIILNFDDNTGDISLDRNINNTAMPAGSTSVVYDIAWSPSGRYLYISILGENAGGIRADVLRYDYNNIASTLTSILNTPIERSYGLQMGADTALYHLYQTTVGGDLLIAKLTKTDAPAISVYEEALFMSANPAGQQFPSFLPQQNVTLNVDFSSTGTCQNAPSFFYADVSPGADSLLWDFGDGNVGRGYNPIHTYTTSQTYNVTLRAYYGTQSETMSNAITIRDFPLMIELVQDTTACREEFPPPRGTSTPQPFSVEANISGGMPVSVTWSNGDMGNTLTPDSSGYYYVVATDASGCSSYAGVNIKEWNLEEQKANIWYFGNNAGIDFNTMPAIALNNSAMTAPEGTSTISDKNGEIILYSNGNQVYDKTHAEIATTIGGDVTSSQSAIIVPVPNDETLFYIFTTQESALGSSYELRYSLFDLKENNGIGAVVTSDILLYAKSTERITANDRWLISHEYGNNTFRAYPIREEGIGNPIFSSIGSPHSLKSRMTGRGYMKLSGNNQIAVALSNPTISNAVELFSFDDATGKLSDYVSIDLQQPNGQAYGIEFGASDNKLFVTIIGNPSTVHEYYIGDPNVPPTRVNVTMQAGVQLGALQTGPDGQIYMAIDGGNALGTIQAVADEATASAINLNGFNLAAGTTSGLGLPNFIQNISNTNNQPSISITGFCLGTPTNFMATPTDPIIDEYVWTFGDGNTSNEQNPVHTYATAGTYNVSLRLTNRCGLDRMFDENITITPQAPIPTIPNAIALCTSDNIVLNANSGNLVGYTYLWSTGETTQTITINQAIIVSVTNTDANGCTSEAETFVADNRPQVNIGQDITVCQSNNASVRLDASNPSFNHVWTINGVNVGNDQLQTVDLSFSGIYNYEVSVTDPTTGCFTVKNKQYDVIVSPSITLTGVDPSVCGAMDGSIQLTINTTNPVGGPYNYVVNGPNNFMQLDNNVRAGNIQIANMSVGAGTYTLDIADQISSCSIRETIALNDPGTFMANFTASDCDPTVITVNILSGMPIEPILYTYENTSTGQVVGPITNNTAEMSPAGGDYIVTIHENNGTGCRISVSQPIAITPKNMEIVSNICATPAVLTATAGATSYSWTGPGIVGSDDVASTTINQSGTYQVIADLNGCLITRTTDAIYDAPQPNFTQSDACSSPNVLLSATATENANYTYSYQWYKEGVFQNMLQGQRVSIGLSEDGANYALGIYNRQNGCLYRTSDMIVNVIGEIDADISSTLACDNGNPFTLTATTSVSNVLYTWLLDDVIINGANQQTLMQTSEGNYRVDISKSICVTSASLTITKFQSPKFNLSSEEIICPNIANRNHQQTEVELDPGIFAQYAWFKDDVAIGSNQTIVAREEGLYKVDVTNEFGCITSDETQVVEYCIARIEAPTAFRPDSKNDENKMFYIHSFFITDEFEVFIYSRWGELIYQSKDKNFQWNGRYNNTGDALPSGHYTYLLKYVSSSLPKQGIQEKIGGIVLLR